MARVEVRSTDTEFDDLIEEMEVEGSFGYTADYASYVNYETHYAGTQPPFDPIRGWVHRKWNDLDAGLKDYANPDGDLSTDEWKDRVAWIVVHAIAENGTKAIRFMERAVERANAAISQLEAPYENSEDPLAAFKLVRDTLDYAFGESQDIIAEEATDRGTLLQSGFVDVHQLHGDEVFERDGEGG